MCGIVAYFGGAGNNLTRVLTGMSAIIYRAPDSTGVAIFGDDRDPIRTRRAVGSIEKLVGVLLDHNIYHNDDSNLLSLWFQDNGMERSIANQRALLAFEGLPADHLDDHRRIEKNYVSYDDLVDLATDSPLRLSPGQPGRPWSGRHYFIRSQKDFERLLLRLILEYDLSPVVIREIIAKPLLTEITSRQEEGPLPADNTDIMAAFERIFEKSLTQIEAVKAERRTKKQLPTNPRALKALWICLPKTPIKIPRDYDRDGVCGVFRLLDQGLLIQLVHGSDLEEALEEILAMAWPIHERQAHVSWRNLYAAEKGANLYGRAAAAALTFLKRTDFVPKMLSDLSRQEIMTESSIVPDQSDPAALRYFTQPVIAHGRWAIQSTVSVRNAHPFLDHHRHRSVAINGQFDGQTEESIRNYLSKVGGVAFRSSNSAEYFPLLWGHYFRQLSDARRRYKVVLTQVEENLEVHGVGSRTIDYSIYNAVKGKSAADLDEAAFIMAADQISRNGGQVAACGMSILSPRRLYVATRNRPIFIVRRLDNDDFMAVSDINAAMGLFPQQLILEKGRESKRLEAEHDKMMAALNKKGVPTRERRKAKAAFRNAQSEILKAFTVEVHSLDQEEVFARIETTIVDQNVCRRVHITDFTGQAYPEIEPFQTVLNPAQVKKDLTGSFYETHLNEIPQRFMEILGYYAAEEDQVPDFNIRTSFLRRRFGTGFSGLKRIILAGTGSAHYMCETAERFFHTLMPEMDIQAIRPGEIERPEQVFMPEKDLVILLSWSSTTADMVLLAKKLLELKVVMVAITEKSYADMALVAAKSGGVIPALSGEEVTVSGVKSTPCMLFCLNLFCLWLAAHMGRREEAIALLEKMHRLPYVLSNLIEDLSLQEISKTLAAERTGCHAAIVIADIYNDGIGREVALKLEENAWSAVGKSLDYREALETGPHFAKGAKLVVVDASGEERFEEALAVMDRLHKEKIDFMVLGIQHRLEDKLQELSNHHAVFLPAMPAKSLQPIATLIFFYRFAFHFGMMHKGALGIAPRNRAKSMTVGRNLFDRRISPNRELADIVQINSPAEPGGGWRQVAATGSKWEKAAQGEYDRNYYAEMRRLADELWEADPSDKIVQMTAADVQTLSRLLFHRNSDIDEIIFAPMDRPSTAAAKNATGPWGRLLGYPVRIVSPCAPLAALGDNVLLFTIASGRLPGWRRRVSERLQSAGCPVFRLEPSGSADHREAQRFLLPADFVHCPDDHIYAALNLIIIAAWQAEDPLKARIVAEHFRQSAPTILLSLDDLGFLEEIQGAMEANRNYRTMFHIGPPTGTGFAWARRLDRTDGILCEAHLFGESAHGPLVTVDSAIAEKFVQLEPRGRLVSKFGSKAVAAWEETYLHGRDTDQFLQQPPSDLSPEPNQPFFVDGIWYFPELIPKYNPVNDNLIFMDAANRRYFNQALDEISTYGCRYPRMVVITQEAFLTPQVEKALYRFPVSDTIFLPRTWDAGIPEMQLPFVMNLIGEALAASFL